MRKCRSLHFPFSANSPITSEEVMVSTSNCGRLPSFPSAGPAPCSLLSPGLSWALVKPIPSWIIPGSRWPHGRPPWRVVTRDLGCHLPPLLEPLVVRALGWALRCIFNFSYPLSKHSGFLPKYLGKIVYLWLLSPPMTHCNLAAAASLAPFMGESG